MKLAEKTSAVFDYVKENGGKIAVPELCDALERNSRSITASVNDLVKKGLVVREVVEATGEGEKDIKYVVLTDAGKTFVPSDDKE